MKTDKEKEAGGEKGKMILLTILILFSIAALVCTDFKIWRLQHPAAPAWTFIFN